VTRHQLCCWGRDLALQLYHSMRDFHQESGSMIDVSFFLGRCRLARLSTNVDTTHQRLLYSIPATSNMSAGTRAQASKTNPLNNIVSSIVRATPWLSPLLVGGASVLPILSCVWGWANWRGIREHFVSGEQPHRRKPRTPTTYMSRLLFINPLVRQSKMPPTLA
jgi:hypothetical protein